MVARTSFRSDLVARCSSVRARRPLLHLRAVMLIAAKVCVLGALTFLVDCSGCGGTTSPSEIEDGGADEGMMVGDARSSGREAGDAIASDDGGGPDAQQDSSLGCLYANDSAAVEAGDAGVICPATPPDAGSPCDVPDYYCEYGNNWWSRCNLLMSCDQGTWQAFDGGADFCPQPDGGPSSGACPADTCPVTWAEAVAIEAGPCPSFSCQYPEGDCLCGINSGAGCSYSAPSAWSCLPANSGCAYPRPRFGTPCTPAPDASVACVTGWQWGCSCEQDQYCNDQGIWVGNPFGEGCMQ